MLTFCLCLIMALATVWSTNAYAVELPEPVKVFEVSPGQKLEEVRDAVRAWRQESPENKTAPVQILVHEGTWFLTDPLQLTEADSHTAWLAQGNVVITKGRELSGWTEDQQGRFVTNVKEVAEGSLWFDTLYVNDRRAVPARTPNDFYYYVQSQGGERTNASGEKEDMSRRAFVVRESERPLFESLAASGTLASVAVKLFHSWSVSSMYLASWDASTATVDLAGSTRYNFDYWGKGKLRYRLSGFKEALDAPGEFFLDRDGTLTYIPRQGETLEHFTAIAPVDPGVDKQGLLKITGNLPELQTRSEGNGDCNDEGLYVTDISWTGFQFTCDPFSIPQTGLSSGQAANQCPAAIVVDVARRVVFQECSVRHTGAWAIDFHIACSDCGVERSLLEDLGAGGVRIGAGWEKIGVTENTCTRNCRVCDCVIRDYGYVDESATGVWIGHSPDNEIVHNEISQGYYTGVSVGWVWGYGKSLATGNKVEFNHIHHIGRGILSDMGGVYSLGISPGTSISNNVIHDVWSYKYGYGGWGLYTDEGSSNILFENNLVYRVRTGTVHQHYGKDNIFRNNILAFSEQGQLQRSREEEHLSFTLERNIILWDKEPLFTRSWPDDVSRYALNHNLYWYCGPKDSVETQEGKFFNGRTLAQWQELPGRDEGSLLADPEFANPAENDFHFAAGQPNEAVQAIGFIPFDYSQAGLTQEGKTFFGEKLSFEYSDPEVPPAPPEN
ncbi:MAG: right-handed parallel beta-helix repeat-containing protein [Planctomycetia bacterium]|nr:right-handed parallel beta-helix repeat-containing protein [Planctomycetia bacterium]